MSARVYKLDRRQRQQLRGKGGQSRAKAHPYPHAHTHPQIDIKTARQVRDPLLDLACRLIAKEVNSGAITIAHIVRRSGVSRTTINNWLHGQTRHPQVITVQFVLRAMGYHIGVIDEAGKEVR